MIKVAPYKPNYSKALLCVKGLDEERRKEILSDLNNACDYSEYLVALDENDACVGYAKTTLLIRGYELINDIFVADDMRREGVGSLILVAIFTRGVDKYVLNVLAKCALINPEAKFFKNRNFISYEKSPLATDESIVGECGKDNNNSDSGYVYFCKNLLHMYSRKIATEN